MPLGQGTWEDAEHLIGVPLAPVTGADVVTATDLRRHLEVLAWDCPIHSDPVAARAAGYRDVVSPRGLTRAWSLPPYWTPGSGEPDVATAVRATMTTLPGEGTAMIGTGNTFDYLDDVYPGDRLTTASMLVSVTRKRTRIGAGAFLVMETAYRNQAGGMVAVEQATGFRYTPAGDPPAGTAAAAGPDMPEPVPPPSEFPAVVLDLTLQRLIMAAGVTRDFSPIHTDSQAARNVGAPAAFANVTLMESLFERAVRQWVGLEARIVRIATTLTGFACAGQQLRVTGRTVKGADAGSRDIAVAISGAAGVAARGQVRLAPKPAGR
jgi:acyl dehydratase